jgi:heat shock protein HspQ
MKQNKFQVGELIHHKRYDYRGVIVQWNPSCEANEEWYQKNKTQPKRNQPWYHVLVDGGAATYVAEENLEPDFSSATIKHPMISRVFSSFHKGRYYKESMN